MSNIPGLKIFVSDKGHDMSLTDYKNQGFGINDSYLKRFSRQLKSYPAFYLNTIQNRLRFLRACRINSGDIFCPTLGLTDEIIFISRINRNLLKGGGVFFKNRIRCDAVITDIVGFSIMFLVADCPVVVLFDQKQSVLALVHSGRENILKNIMGKTARIMKEELSCDPEDIFAHFPSPHLCRKCHFLTFLGFNGLDPEIERIRPAIVEKEGGWEFDARRAIKIQLGAEGVEKIIQRDTKCTLCNGKGFFSHRGWTTRHPDHPKIGRFAVMAMMEEF